MMNRVWGLCGRVAYKFSWPALWIYLFNSRRTRVLVLCGEEVLVVRGWLGNGGWALPGGGLHRGESADQGAVRELMEETGIDIGATDLQLLLTKEPVITHGFRFYVDAFVVELEEKPASTRQKFEISEISWINLRTLEQQRQSIDIQKVLAAFYER